VNYEFICLGVHGTFPILTLAGLNFAITCRASHYPMSSSTLMEGQSKQNPACQLLISNYTKQTFKRNSLEKGQFSLLLRRLSFEATSLKMLFKVLKLGRHTYSPLILDAKYFFTLHPGIPLFAGKMAQ